MRKLAYILAIVPLITFAQVPPKPEGVPAATTVTVIGDEIKPDAARVIIEGWFDDYDDTELRNILAMVATITTNRTDALSNYVHVVEAVLSNRVVQAAVQGSNHVDEVAGTLPSMIGAVAVAGTNYTDEAIQAIPPVIESDPVALPLLAAHTNDASIHMSQAGAMALITSFADTGTVARARCAEKLGDSTGGQYWLTVDGGDVVMHEIVPDTTRLYIASWSEDYNGPRVQTPFAMPEVGQILDITVQFALERVTEQDWEFSDFLGVPEDSHSWLLRSWEGGVPFKMDCRGIGLEEGNLTFDYVPVTNSYPLPLWPQVRAEVAGATNQIWQAMMGNTNTTIEIIGDDLTIYAESNAVKVAIWQSKASMGGGGVNQSVIDDLYSQIGVLQAAINQLAPKAWGNYAPDGSVNPDPSYMVLHNRPVTMHASGFQWATYGEISVLATYGETAFETGGDGTIRWGLDVHTNFIAMVRGGSVTIGANPDKIKLVADEMQITYPYTGGSFPQLQYTTSLFMPFEPYDGATWEDNGDGTATAYIPTVSVSGFVKATTTYQASAYVDIGPVTRFRDGIQGDAHQMPVVYDSTITVQAGGKSYRIPAEAQ